MQFLAPAFLGDAVQNGVWRTPPIKALWRQWWRVAYAAEHGFRVGCEQDMRHAEGLLFGHADSDAASRSLVRLRLDRWDEGKLQAWQALPRIEHPEVKDRNTGRLKPVGADLYLGYGPLAFVAGQTQLNKKNAAIQAGESKKNAAIQAGESATLRLAYPEEDAELLEHALWLMDRYGTLGGRSRNGWGSFFLKPTDNVPLTGTLPLRDWQDCLDRDWPHAIGKNKQGTLIWQTTPQADWKAVMKELARIKIGLRTRFAFTTGKNAPHPEARHWLSYPVTNHSVYAWDNYKEHGDNKKQSLRLPNSLRFKLRPAQNGQVAGVIFHVPCLPPQGFRPQRNEIEPVWQQVHGFLDQQQPSLKRIPE
ncbi:MAG: hypothetical protein LBQ81_05870 [Zoogloeaceae bacterium]|nr:hypothetical protein [Zoogloeaceae bacterium]